MKLRNKKTGEIRDGRVEVIFQDNDKFPNPLERHRVDSLAELNEEWEDYKPAEPLIKDKKIRKAVRAWAEVNGIHNCDHLRYDKGCQSLTDIYTRNEISFNYKFETLDDGIEYTIAELCGEEEE